MLQSRRIVYVWDNGYSRKTNALPGDHARRRVEEKTKWNWFVEVDQTKVYALFYLRDLTHLFMVGTSVLTSKARGCRCKLASNIGHSWDCSSVQVIYGEKCHSNFE